MSSTKNKDIKSKDIQTLVPLEKSVAASLERLSKSASLSPRSYHRVLRLARTIADLRESATVEEQDILEAFQYRPKLYQELL